MNLRNQKSQTGYSVAELLVVVSITAIMTSVSLLYLYQNQKLYKPMNRQPTLLTFSGSQTTCIDAKTTMRVELDITDNVARLINENEADHPLMIRF